MRETGRGSRKLCAEGREHEWVAGDSARFSAGDFLHGVDQHRQPQAVATFRSPYLKLLTHRPFLCLPNLNSKGSRAFRR
ncbi:MAG: hypothetical protein QOK03_1677 [Candidatus Binataceae bacterium]|jgi:hypothetical protein|nr:hypothetical protein [Candidatus Binataceae bacterium]